MKRIGFRILILLCIPSLLSTKSYYVETREKSLGDACVASEVQEMDPGASLPWALDQGNTLTCYGHAALQVLQYLYTVSQLKQNKTGFEVLSLADVLGQACNWDHSKNGWVIYGVLHNLKSRFLALNLDYDLQNLVKFFEWVKTGEDCNGDSCCKRLEEDFAVLERDLLPNAREIFNHILAKKEDSAAHQILFGALKEPPRQGRIPPYNIEVHEFNQEYLSRIKKKEPAKSKIDVVIDKVCKLLSPNPVDQFSYPVTLSFCPEEDAQGACPAFHVVVLAGTRKVCCHGECKEEWLVVDSYGEESNGWYEADVMAESLLKHKGSLTSARFCKRDPHDLRPLPLCEPHILGPYPMHYLAAAGDLETLKKMIGKGPGARDKMNNLDRNGDSVLTVAARMGYLPIVKYLIERGAALSPGGGTESPLVAAASRGHLSTVRFLLEKKADVNELSQLDSTPLIIASANGHLPVVQALYAAGARIDQQNRAKWTPLIAATHKGNREVVEFLLDHGAHLEHEDKEGNTALLYAGLEGHEEVVAALLKRGANVNHMNAQEWTPLNAAATQGKLSVARSLIEGGAHIEAENQARWTPLMSAAHYGSVELVDLLLQHGANPEHVDARGLGALHYAALMGHQEVIESLLLKQSKINRVSEEGWTPLLIAASQNRWEAVSFIMDRGGDPEIPDAEGWTPLLTAAQVGHLETVKVLVEKGARKGVRDFKGNTPLSLAAGAGQLEVVDYLLSLGVDLDEANSQGLTPLARAVDQGYIQVVRSLMKKGASPWFKSIDGKTLRDLAQSNQNTSTEMLQLVESYMKSYEGSAQKRPRSEDSTESEHRHKKQKIETP